jgi:hypothetical protein
MIKEIPKSDVITRPMKVYKEWTLDENDIYPIFGIDGEGTFIDSENDAKSHGFVKKIIYASTKSQFYLNPQTSSLLTEVGLRKSYASADERMLESEMAIFSIPQQYYGEGIKIGTVVLEDETLSRTYTDDGYSNLIDSGSNIKGNIFYDRGLIVVTKDVVSGSVLNNFTINFRSTKTIYENEIFISVLENEFNVSQNPSAVYEDGGSKITQLVNRPGSSNNSTELVTSSFYDAGIKWIRGKKYPFVSTLDSDKFGSFDDYLYSGSVDPTGSYLAPYITTIALYDEELNMVAVAKLPQPIKSLPDYPLNFIVRFDT